MSEPGPPPPTGGMPGWAPAPSTPAASGWGAAPTANPYGYSTPPWGPPGHDPKRRYKRGALVWSALAGAVGAFVLMIVLLVIIGLAIGDDGKTSSISATHPLAEESSQAVKVGECLSASPNDAVVVGRGQVVTCTGQHGSEVIGLAQYPDSQEYPDSDDLGGFADKACAVPFHDYVGKTATDSDISGKSIVPNRTAWRAVDRKVWCLVDSDTYRNGRGSVRGANE